MFELKLQDLFSKIDIKSGAAMDNLAVKSPYPLVLIYFLLIHTHMHAYMHTCTNSFCTHAHMHTKIDSHTLTPIPTHNYTYRHTWYMSYCFFALGDISTGNLKSYSVEKKVIYLSTAMDI